MHALGLERVIGVCHDWAVRWRRGSLLISPGWPSAWSLGLTRRDAFLSLDFHWTQTGEQTTAEDRTRT